jgi:nucleoside-diphosphate-sugar epimerase
MQICLAGSTGFIGSAIVQMARQTGEHEVTPVSAARISGSFSTEPLRAAFEWVTANTEQYARLVGMLQGDVVVNAAGLAAPGSGDAHRLRAANAVWPVVLSLACEEAGVPRLVQVSSAAVQGRRNPLDESEVHQPFSPYTRSKAEGEGALLRLRRADTGARQLVIYRPTSVHGCGRQTTATLVRLSRLRHLPVTDGGRQPLPLALVENVAAASLLLASTPDPPLVALHPWENITTERLLEYLAPGTARLAVPRSVVRAGLSCVRRAGSMSPRLRALSRQLDLVYVGQQINARALTERGYVPPVGVEGWQRLAPASSQ